MDLDVTEEEDTSMDSIFEYVTEDVAADNDNDFQDSFRALEEEDDHANETISKETVHTNKCNSPEVEGAVGQVQEEEGAVGQVQEEEGAEKQVEEEEGAEEQREVVEQEQEEETGGGAEENSQTPGEAQLNFVL